MGREMERGRHRNALAEVIGTFALVFVGVGSVVATGGQNLLAMALGHGLTVGVMVAAAGHISGGIYNPAIVCGLVAARRMPVMRGVYYVVAQLAAALLAALVLKAIFPATAINTVQLGTPQLGPGIGAAAE